jgi:hypothetical protein
LYLAAILAFTHALQLITDDRWRRLPPKPFPLPVISSLYAITWSRAHRSLAHLAERYGPPHVHLMLHNSDLAGRTVLDVWHIEGHVANSVIGMGTEATI